MITKDIEDIIPEIKKLNWGILHAQFAMSINHPKEESDFWEIEYKRLKNDKEHLLKGVFGL